jgi:hypothetical protein
MGGAVDIPKTSFFHEHAHLLDSAVREARCESQAHRRLIPQAEEMVA